MVSLRTGGSGRHALLALAGLLLSGTMLAAAPALAGLADGCRVPEAYLAIPPALDRTESRVLGKRDVRVVVLGPLLGKAVGTKSPLEHALESRMPGINFEIMQALSPGLAADDFARLRTLMHGETPPDLVIWQVGVRDAMAASDVQDFEETLDRAHDWIEERGSDLILVDPPFVPGVPHERIYNPYVGELGDLSREEGVPVLRRYAAMQYLEAEADRFRLTKEQRRPCVPELVAEAIIRAVGK